MENCVFYFTLIFCDNVFFYYATFIVAVAAVAGYNVYKSQSVMNGMSEFALANVEALARDENSGNSIICYSGEGSSFLCKCSSCTWGYTGTSSKGKCY